MQNLKTRIRLINNYNKEYLKITSLSLPLLNNVTNNHYNTIKTLYIKHIQLYRANA